MWTPEAEEVFKRYPFLPQLLVRRVGDEPLVVETVQVSPMTPQFMKYVPLRLLGANGRDEYEEMLLVHVDEEGRASAIADVRPDQQTEKPHGFFLSEQGEPVGQALLRADTDRIDYIVSIANYFHSMECRWVGNKVLISPVETVRVVLFTQPGLGINETFSAWVESAMGLARV